jgi:hypothetical protein
LPIDQSGDLVHCRLVKVDIYRLVTVGIVIRQYAHREPVFDSGSDDCQFTSVPT